MTSTNNNNSSQHQPSYSIRLVFQRYRKATIVLDDSKIVTLGGGGFVGPGGEGGGSSSSSLDDQQEELLPPKTTTTTGKKNSSTLGVLVYVSFSSKLSPSTTDIADSVIEQAAKTILQLPIHTFGRWGDGVTTSSGEGDGDGIKNSKRRRNQTQSLIHILSSTEHQYHRHRDDDDDDEQQQQQQQQQWPKMSRISLLIVPQANLISKVYKNGKSIQYQDQISPKDLGQEMFDKLCATVRTMLIDHQVECRNNTLDKKTNNNNKGSKQNQPTTPDPSIPPNELFRRGRYEGLYATYDPVTGIPLTLMVKDTGKNNNDDDDDEHNGQKEQENTIVDINENNTISKSARKKLQKIYDAHTKRHEKWKLKQQQTQQVETLTVNDGGGDRCMGCNDDKQGGEGQEQTTTTIAGISDPSVNEESIKKISLDPRELDPSFIQFVTGSFGKRQGLELFSDMGPFCHIVDV